MASTPGVPVVSFKKRIKDSFKKTISLMGIYDWRHRGRVTILMYHRVLPQAQLQEPIPQASLAVSAEAFESNMRFLRNRYTLISFSEYLDRVAIGDWAPDRRYALVTFDDGWSDNYFHAFPILSRYAVPATIFVATGFIDTQRGFWWQAVGDAMLHAWRHRHNQRPIFEVARAHGLQEAEALKEVFQTRHTGDVATHVDSFIERLKAYQPQSVQHFADDCASLTGTSSPTPMAMTRGQMAEMSSQGIEFGSHSVNHYSLTALSVQDAAAEIVDSATVLKSRRDVNYTPVFAYPNGDANVQVRDVVRQAGYRAAVTTEPRVTGFRPTDPYGLPRIDVSGPVAASNLLYKLKLSRAVADKTRTMKNGWSSASTAQRRAN